MADILEIDLNDEDRICKLSSALSSPARIQILKLLYFNSYSVVEIAQKLDIPTSSAALYVRSLEEAGLINTYVQKRSRGSSKICSRKNDFINIKLITEDETVHKAHSISMPVGAYSNCSVSPTCGIASELNYIGHQDRPDSFFLPEHYTAQILWSSNGFVEYLFPFPFSNGEQLERLILSFEACSEAANYKEDWPSEISVDIDGLDCGTWFSSGDHGERRGRLNPAWWPSGCTQYGELVKLEISTHGTFINSKFASNTTVKNFCFSKTKPIVIRIGNRPEARCVGGFSLFGKKFGDVEQDIVLSLIY